MSRRRGPGTNKLFEMFLNGLIKDTHHLTPRGEGGSNKKSNKKEGPVIDHKVWHFFTKGCSSLDEVANKFSGFVSRDCKFFAVDITDPQHGIVKINNWIENFGNGDYVTKISIKRRSKIIRFRPREDLRLPKIVS